MDEQLLKEYRSELAVDPRKNRRSLPQDVPAGRPVMISFPRTEAGKWLAETFHQYCEDEAVPASALGRCALLEFLVNRGVV